MRTTIYLLTAMAGCFWSPAASFAQSREQYRECQSAVSQRLNRPMSDISTRSGPRISNGNTIVNWEARTDRGRINGSCEAAPNGRIVDIDMGNSAGAGGGGFGGGFGNGGNGNGAERSCRSEVSRRIQTRPNSIGTQVIRQTGNRTQVSWNADGGRRGFCEVDRSLRVVNFREEGGSGGNWGGNDRPGFGGGGGRGVSIRARMSGNGGDGKCTFEVEVDGVAEVEISGDRGYLRTLSGTPATWRRLDCNRAMPQYPQNFRFQGIDGRGRQDLVRDPGSNGGTAVVRIEDPKGGREGYTGDVKWR